jgi:hypothetical protein
MDWNNNLIAWLSTLTPYLELWCNFVLKYHARPDVEAKISVTVGYRTPVVQFVASYFTDSTIPIIQVYNDKSAIGRIRTWEIRTVTTKYGTHIWFRDEFQVSYYEIRYSQE